MTPEAVILQQLYKNFPDFVVIAEVSDAAYEAKYTAYVSLLEQGLIEHNNFDGAYILKPEDRSSSETTYGSTLSARLSEKGLAYLRSQGLIRKE